MKARGSHPLKANVMRAYTIQCTKENAPKGDAIEETIQFLKKLFPIVWGMGGHVIKLCPYNQTANAPVYWDPEEMVKGRVRLRGIYLGNIMVHNWKERLIWI